VQGASHRLLQGGARHGELGERWRGVLLSLVCAARWLTAQAGRLEHV
jgi:hypothetical protein